MLNAWSEKLGSVGSENDGGVFIHKLSVVIDKFKRKMLGEKRELPDLRSARWRRGREREGPTGLGLGWSGMD